MDESAGIDIGSGQIRTTYTTPDDGSTGQAAQTTHEVLSRAQTTITDVGSRPTRPRARGDQAAKATAGLLLGAIEALAVARWKTEEARMTGSERAMIEPPIVAWIAKLPARHRDRLANLAGPITLIIGFTMYAQRLANLERRRQSETDEQRAVAQASEITRPGGNGIVPTGQQPNGSIPIETTDGNVPPARTDVIRGEWTNNG